MPWIEASPFLQYAFVLLSDMNGLSNSVVVKFLNSSNIAASVKSRTYGGNYVNTAVDQVKIMRSHHSAVSRWSQTGAK